MEKNRMEIANKLAEKIFKDSYGEGKANRVVCLIRSPETEKYLDENNMVAQCHECGVEVIRQKNYPNVVSKKAIMICMICVRKILKDEKQSNIVSKMIEAGFN